MNRGSLGIALIRSTYSGKVYIYRKLDSSEAAMQLWQIRPSPHFKPLVYVHTADVRKARIQHPPGQRFGDLWKTYPLQFSTAPEDAHNPEGGDFPVFKAGMLTCSRRALVALSPLLEDHVEILPLKCQGYDYSLLNVLTIVDCVDYSRTEAGTWAGGAKRIRGMPYFLPGCVPDVSMFKIQELGGIFVSDEFKQVVERHDLVGLRFIPVIE